MAITKRRGRDKCRVTLDLQSELGYIDGYIAELMFWEDKNP
jgi:hypothetical protein